ncbi:hypothetical protein [Salinigranum sp.]|uniref:hypothetical protein n=1 Tax=Salinigranum sp. TaxID=1966351 RepID=UPI0035634C56
MVSRPTVAVCLAIVAVLAAGVTPLPVGAATYELSSPDAVDTPDRTVTVSGTDFEVSETARVSKGDPIRLDTTGPSGTSYSVELRDSDRVYRDDAEATGNDRVTFSTSSLAPGTYFAVVFAEGSVQTLYPIVVKKYDVSSVNVPSTADAGASFDVSAQVTQETSGPALDAVEVAITDGSEDIVVQQELSADGSDEYAGTVSVPDEGDYNVYVFARGEDELDGERVFLGLSDPTSLEVEAADDTSDDGGNSGNGGDGGSDGSSSSDDSDSDSETTETPTATPTDTPTATPTDTPTDTPTEMPTDTPTETTGTSDGDTESGSAGGADSTDASTDEPTTEQSTETSAPLGAVPLLLALLLVGGIALRLRR